MIKKYIAYYVLLQHGYIVLTEKFDGIVVDSVMRVPAAGGAAAVSLASSS